MSFPEKIRSVDGPRGPEGPDSFLAPMVAGLCGAIPYGFLIAAEIQTIRNLGIQSQGLDHLIQELLALLPLMPFVVASSRIDGPHWPRAGILILLGLLIGSGLGIPSVLNFVFAACVFVPVALLGLIFSLATLLASRREPSGRALGLLGMAPTFMLLIIAIEQHLRLRTRDLGWLNLLSEWDIKVIVASFLAITETSLMVWSIRRARRKSNPKREMIRDRLD